MAKVILIDWDTGMKKVSLTTIQQDMLGIGLKVAKENVDLLLAGHRVSIDVPDHNLAIAFKAKIENIGVVCELVL